MEPEYLAVLIPAGLALFLEKGPRFVREWWSAKIEKDWKPAVLLLLCLIVPLLAMLAACNGIDVGLGATCTNSRDPQLWVSTIGLGLLAWLVTQGAYLLVRAPDNALTLNVERMSAPISVSTVAPAAPTAQPAATMPSGPGAIGQGVSVQPLLAPEFIPFDQYPDTELAKMERAIQLVRESRRGPLAG